MSNSDPRTLLDFLGLASDFLDERGAENARLNAELLLCEVVGLKRIELYLAFDRPLARDEIDAYRSLLARRAKGEPLQYILGFTEFYGRRFRVGRDVLIPRPETEVLVETALERISADQTSHGVDASHVIADIGTGTGCIGLTLAAECPDARVIATDVSDNAIAVARQNAVELGLTDRVEFRLGDLLEPVAGEPVIGIVSNPPYVAEADREKLQVEVRDHEPALALFAGEDGLDVIRRLIEAAPRALPDLRFVALEIGLGQSDRVAELWRRSAPDWELAKVRDLAGIERIIVATAPPRA
jgi:release factor glutamine methyltransferase